ncbi:major facilitator transporter [Rhodococcus opacus RKJ300 = JCM 13270]|uniref:Major facilitator transporter n=1 Tax=Rhodococcus opacus RKJ300 = JCM 13270 TaxID=1165867 RepID=I0WPV7_RHOOP|nr:major facilitator transporter [Rhodococcus opacus RKJ300 = JCM 13270]
MSTRDLIPLYGLYDLLFADHGLSVGQISSLFVIWSVVSFVAEVPSGAWADTVSRRGLLVFASVLYTAGFSVWILVPSYAGFAAGFVLWGISGAIQSGTFEALLYDELVARGAAGDFARLLGYANSGAMVCNLLATLTAAPLYVLGGYPLVGWVSVGATVVHGGLRPAAARGTQGRGGRRDPRRRGRTPGTRGPVRRDAAGRPRRGDAGGGGPARSAALGGADRVPGFRRVLRAPRPRRWHSDGVRTAARRDHGERSGGRHSPRRTHGVDACRHVGAGRRRCRDPARRGSAARRCPRIPRTRRRLRHPRQRDDRVGSAGAGCDHRSRARHGHVGGGTVR